MAGVVVGRTPLLKSIELCGKCKGATVLVKDESKNPFGTFKDRRCAALLELHASKPEVIFVHVTSGNSGYSLGMMAKQWETETGHKRTVVNIVPKGTSKTIIERLKACSLVHEMEVGKRLITQEEMHRIARELSGHEGEHVVGVEDYGLEGGYRQIIGEIADAGIKPEYIFCPVGEGELAVELAAASEEKWGEKSPKIVGVTIDQNVIVRQEDFLEKPGKSIADKLLNGYSKFKRLLLNFVDKGHAELMVVGENDIAKEYDYLKEIGMTAEPSAAAAFCGAARYDLKPQDVVVIINTGKGIYDQSSVEKIWKKRLLRVAKYAAVFLVGVAITAAGLIGYWYNEMQKKALERELEKERLGALVTEASFYANRDGDTFVSSEELLSICRIIPERECNGEERPLAIYDFSEVELDYYVRFRRLEMDHGMWARQVPSLTDEFRRRRQIDSEENRPLQDRFFDMYMEER
ncbi:PLP-dependent lyase/thiolase [Candidatus Micrarchaeota archaeon]|nr:PLP-dependent lyase/thiolase [Candidatus Micrarchaeota archaeon]